MVMTPMVESKHHLKQIQGPLCHLFSQVASAQSLSEISRIFCQKLLGNLAVSHGVPKMSQVEITPKIRGVSLLGAP